MLTNLMGRTGGTRDSSARRPGRRSLSSAAGQTLPLGIVFMVVLFGMGGFVIDLGNSYLQKRQTQSVADAAALAGAATIPQGTWQATAQQKAAANDKHGDQAAMAPTGGGNGDA